MAGIIEIELSHLRFFGHHGLYEEETKTGAEFEVNLLIRYAARETVITAIVDTIDYVRVYEVIKQHVGARKELLETTAMQIGLDLKKEFNRIVSIRMTLKKLAPPITNFSGDISVTYEQTF
jgi:dihydroneopterin aldolase